MSAGPHGLPFVPAAAAGPTKNARAKAGERPSGRIILGRYFQPKKSLTVSHATFCR